MAFTTAITLPRKHIPNAYIRASILQATTQRAEILLEIWESPEQRSQLAIPTRVATRVFLNPANFSNENPTDYAYQLLEAGSEFPNATWRV